MEREDWLNLGARLSAINFVLEIVAARQFAAETPDIQAAIIDQTLALAESRASASGMNPEDATEMLELTIDRLQHSLARIAERADQIRAATS